MNKTDNLTEIVEKTREAYKIIRFRNLKGDFFFFYDPPIPSKDFM